MLRSVALNTLKAYLGCFSRWATWCRRVAQCEPLPLVAVSVCSYLRYLVAKCRSYTSVLTAVAALKWWCNFSHSDDITQSFEIKCLVSFAKRTLPVKLAKKSAVTQHMIVLIVERFGGSSATAADLRKALICVLGFAGFFRISELLNIRASDIYFSPCSSYFRVRVPLSKTDQFGRGHDVIIASTGTASCPMQLLKRYIRVCAIKLNSSEYLFRRLSHGGKLVAGEKPLSTGRARSLFAECIDAIGYDRSHYSPHMLRRGGATTASNAGASDRAVQRQGRWRSAASRELYIETDVREQLRLSKALQL